MAGKAFHFMRSILKRKEVEVGEEGAGVGLMISESALLFREGLTES